VGVGEALVSTLEGKGVPSVVERTLIRPPSSQIGPITAAERKAVLANSPIAGLYEAAVDRESAFEVLRGRAEKAAKEAEAEEKREEQLKIEAAQLKEEEKRRKAEERELAKARRYEAPKRKRSSRGDSIGTSFAKSLVRAAGSRAGRSLIRGVMGSLFKGR